MSDLASHVAFHCDGYLDDTKFVVTVMVIKIKQLEMGGAKNAGNITLGESQDPRRQQETS